MSDNKLDKEERIVQLLNEYKEIQSKVESLINKANKILLELESLNNE